MPSHNLFQLPFFSKATSKNHPYNTLLPLPKKIIQDLSIINNNRKVQQHNYIQSRSNKTTWLNTSSFYPHNNMQLQLKQNTFTSLYHLCLREHIQDKLPPANSGVNNTEQLFQPCGKQFLLLPGCQNKRFQLSAVGTIATGGRREMIE